MSGEIERAMEMLQKRIHMPGIEAKEAMLINLSYLQLKILLDQEWAIEDMIKAEELELMRSEALGEGSKEDIGEWKKQIERHKARLLKRVKENKGKVRKILEDAKLE